MREQLTITHVAIKVGDKIYSLPKPNRHNDVIRMAIELGENPPIDGHGENSGFLASNGVFMNRYQSGAVAYISGQTKTRIKELNSEHVW